MRPSYFSSLILFMNILFISIFFSLYITASTYQKYPPKEIGILSDSIRSKHGEYFHEEEFETESIQFYDTKDERRGRRGRRKKRYAIEGSYWGVKNITYKIVGKSKSMSLEELENLFKRAFAVWEDHTLLKFHQIKSGEAHIDILFTEGEHGDGEPFDGAGKILAHAYFPRYGGDLHFDDDELWSPDKHDIGLDLYAVAVHEIGHSLGLKHSSEKNAIMAPFYQKYTGEKLYLHKDDLSGLDRLYGPSGAANRLNPVTTLSPESYKYPDICRRSTLDAITRLPNGSIYAFQGDYFWELDESGPLSLRPRKLSTHWKINGSIDAAMTNTEGNTYIFKNTHYWVFSRDVKLLPGYPKEIRKGLIDTPDKLDAAMIWNYDDRPYFFKKDKYWKYSRWGMPRTWPRTIRSLFKGKPPSKVDTGLKLNENSSYIFAGEKYWKLTGFRYMKISDGYPRSIATNWFNCDGQIHRMK